MSNEMSPELREAVAELVMEHGPKAVILALINAVEMAAEVELSCPEGDADGGQHETNGNNWLYIADKLSAVADVTLD